MVSMQSLIRINFLSWTIAGSLSFTAPNVDNRIDFWLGDIRSALEEAQTKDKLVFVDVYALRCTSCKLMEESTFRSPEVVRILNEHYVPLKIDVDSPEGKMFAAQENVQTLPVLEFLDAKGNRLTKVDQALNSAEILDVLNKHISPEDRQHNRVLSDHRR